MMGQNKTQIILYNKATSAFEKNYRKVATDAKKKPLGVYAKELLRSLRHCGKISLIGVQPIYNRLEFTVYFVPAFRVDESHYKD